jgi:hypothetical protein
VPYPLPFSFLICSSIGFLHTYYFSLICLGLSSRSRNSIFPWNQKERIEESERRRRKICTLWFI